MAIENKTAVLALTRQGVNQAHRLYDLLENVQLMVPKRLEQKYLPGDTVYFESLQQLVQGIFPQYRQLIFVMATGIVVRTIAPLLNSKKTDPAVVVLDELGHFAISLISGHLGGANKLTLKVAMLLGSTPVITTATDIHGVTALDTLAKELGCQIYPSAGVKVFNRMLVEGEEIDLYSEWPLPREMYSNFNYFTGENFPRGPFRVYITNKRIKRLTGTTKVGTAAQHLILRPKNLVVGVGCRKNVTGQQVVEAIKSCFRIGGYSIHSLKAIATVDIKMTEAGIVYAAKYFNVPLVEVSKKQIISLDGSFIHSDFVKEKIGVGGVCEPAAMTVSGMGPLRISKQKIGPVTVALAEARLWWWEWDQETGEAVPPKQ